VVKNLFKKKQEKFNKKNQKLKISDIRRNFHHEIFLPILKKLNFSE
jgi:hypothetical protein